MGASRDRRAFLKLSALTTALLSAGQLPVLASAARGQGGAAAGLGDGVDGHLGPWAIKPLRSFQHRFTPAAGEIGEAYALTYRTLLWTSPLAVGASKCQTIGELRIARGLEGGAAVFEVEQDIEYHSSENHLEARITCEGPSPVAWSLTTRNRWISSSYAAELREEGSVRDGKIKIDNGTYVTELEATRPLVTQWTVLDELMRSEPRGVEREVDLLQDLSLLKPGQELRFDGDIELRLAGGPTKLATVAQHGYGLNPVHYLIDEGGIVQLVTHGCVSWVLVSVEGG